jgi:GNAT superfamily N-acetyltransferase
MDRDELLAVFDREQRLEIEWYGTRREATSSVVRQVPEPGYGGEGSIIYSQLTADNADEVITEQVRYFEGLGLDFEWKAYDHDQPPDLLARLTRFGLEPEDPEAVMVLDLDHAPAALWQPIRHDVRRVREPARLGEVLAVHERVWGASRSHPWLAGQLAQEMTEDAEHISVYVAYLDGMPASSAWIRFHPPSQFASLWGGSTVPEHRRRGLYTALLSIRAQEAWHRGFRFLTIDASPMSRPIVEKHGFQFLTYAYACKWHRRDGSSQSTVPQEP